MQTDTLIIGSGIAGATAALKLAIDRQRQITLLTRSDTPLESNTFYAQGGIVGRGPNDSAEILVEDVLRAGAGISYPRSVQLLADEGPKLINEILIESSGIKFDKDPSGNLIFGLEGAHSRPRILHIGDATGRAIMTSLMNKVQEQANITILTSHTVVDLITFPHHARDPLAVYGLG